MDEIEISCRVGPLGYSKIFAVCFFKKDGLAVTGGVGDYCKKYVVTHIRTGLLIDPPIGSKKLAIKFCKELLKLYDWTKIETSQKAKRLHALKKKIAELRKNLKLPSMPI